MKTHERRRGLNVAFYAKGRGARTMTQITEILEQALRAESPEDCLTKVHEALESAKAERIAELEKRPSNDCIGCHEPMEHYYCPRCKRLWES